MQQLKDLGLTDGEIAVYRALLKIGQSTKTAIVDESGISPANLYDIANRLAEKGLVAITTIDNVKHFSAAHPEALKDLLESKRKAIDEQELTLGNILPQLRAEYEETSTKQSVEIFTGWEGLKTVFADMLREMQAEDECLVSGASITSHPTKADRFFLRQSKLRADKGIKLRIIFSEELKQRQNRIEFFLKNDLCEVRFLHQNSLSETMLYNDTAIMLMLGDTIQAIRIRDPGVASTLKEQFEILWETATGHTQPKNT